MSTQSLAESSRMDEQIPMQLRSGRMVTVLVGMQTQRERKQLETHCQVSSRSMLSLDYGDSVKHLCCTRCGSLLFALFRKSPAGFHAAQP